MDIAGSTVMVTGASSGIGAALAPRLAAHGATVAVVARRADRLAEIVAQCRQHTSESTPYVADLADLDALDELVTKVWEDLGGIDILVNNAGAPMRRRVQHLTVDDVQRTMALNFESPMRLTLAALPRMLRRDHGMIVNVSSFGGRSGILGEAAYCASKFALAGWSESLALDLWHTGVDVRLILPGAIATEIWDQPGNDAAHYEGPFEPPEEVADGIIAAIGSDQFEHYLPDMKSIAEFKTSAIDDYLAGTIAFTDPAPSDRSDDASS